MFLVIDTQQLRKKGRWGPGPGGYLRFSALWIMRKPRGP
jgi:hypothetical protein